MMARNQLELNQALEFERMRKMAELRALSDYSLMTPLDEKQYKRMMELWNDMFPDNKLG